MSKRGQLTILIILGLLVLLSIVLVVFLRAGSEEILEEQVPSVSQIAFDVQPVRDYVQTCTEQTAKQGLRQLGDQGGYITHNFATNALDPTEGDAVQFAPASSLAIPYWLHMSADNDCTGDCPFVSQRPALTSTPGQPNVEDQLETYIENNLPSCLGNYESLSAQGFSITPDGSLDAQVTIGDTQVHVVVNYPLEVTRAGTQHRITDYLTTLDVNLREIFTLASDIVNTQAETRFLEQYTRNIIDGFSEIDSASLPPVTGFAIDFGPGEVWVKRDVQQSLSRLLQTYIPLLQVHGSRNYAFIEAPTDQNIADPEIYEVIYNRGALIPLNNTPRNTNVKFSYLDWWTPYTDLNCKGQICQGQSASSTFGFLFGMQQYSFAYDLSYPVLVEIHNPDAFKNEGYSFKFFLESNIRNNKPMQADFAPLTAVDIPSGSQLCDLDKRFSGDINLNVINGRTGRPAEKFYPTFQCGEEACAFNALHNGTGTIRTPLCIGGTLGVETPGAQPAYTQLDTFYNESANITLTIEPVRHVDFAIRNYVLRKSANNWELDTTNTIGQEPDEETIIQLERIGGPYEKPFSTFASIKGDAFSTARDHHTDIPLVPGRYNVIITSFKYAQPPIEIPARTVSVNTGGFGGSQSVNIPGTEFNRTNPLPVVGVEFEWEVTKEQLDTHNTIQFHGVKFGLDSVPEQDRDLSDLEVIGDVSAYYQAYPSLLEPEYLNE